MMALTTKEITARLLAEFGSIANAFYSGESDGICYECGHIQAGVEPDAKNYTCNNCGKNEVYGVEETIITRL